MIFVLEFLRRLSGGWRRQTGCSSLAPSNIELKAILGPLFRRRGVKRGRRFVCFLGLLVLVMWTSNSVSAQTVRVPGTMARTATTLRCVEHKVTTIFKNSRFGMSNGIATQTAILRLCLIHWACADAEVESAGQYLKLRISRQ